MSNSTKAQTGNDGAGIAWLYNPPLDLIIGCGAWSLPLLVVAYAFTASAARAGSLAFYALALLFNYPHYMATIYRAYHRPEDFRKYRIFTVHITALILLTVLASHFWSGILPWIFTLYLTWSPWHYTGQNYGVFMMFARRAGASVQKTDRNAIYGAFVASYLILFISFHTGSSSDPLFHSLGIPVFSAHCAEIVLAAAFVSLSIYGFSPLVRDLGWRKLTPGATLFSSQILWFLLPVGITLVKGLQVPQSRYSNGVLAVMHAAQYLWVTSYYARREASQISTGKWRTSGYFAVLVGGGIALFVPGPWLASRIFHHDFTASFLIFTALVNLHHFILDGAIWKLRDGRIASLLLDSKDRVTETASRARSCASQTWEWVAGESSSARRVRITAALVLVAWAVADQTRYYFALHSDNLGDLRLAAELNPFDGPTQLHLGEEELQAGDARNGEEALRKAVASNPADAAPQQALLRFLIGKQRFAEAYNLAKESLSRRPNDPNLWLDLGLLALQRGDSSEAQESWRHALELDPARSLAHFYLAAELDRIGQLDDAVTHYKSFLGAIARQPIAKRPPAEKVIAVVLRMADCEARASHPEEAIQTYEMAEKIAGETKQAKLESIATVSEAVVQESSGKLSDSMSLYRRAIQLDESIGDKQAEAEDWLAYGHLLERSGYPPRLSYACFVRAASMKEAFSDASQRQYLADMAIQAEKRAGKAAAGVRSDPGPALREALAIQP